MVVRDKRMPWCFLFLLAGAMGQTVNYSGPVCAVKNSTVTLPCTFKPFESLIEDGRQVFPQVIRVRWCQNHEICQGTTPSVYNSDSKDNGPRYRYLGDMKGNCTLQIRNVKMADDATFRFRMELDYSKGHFTGRSGVVVRVVEGTQMRIKGSSDGGMMREGETVTLRCTSACTFHQLEVTWSRNDRVLQEFGSALQLGPLTAEDSGNYTCGLKKNRKTRSLPYMLHVQPVDKGEDGNVLLIVGVVLGVFLALCALILVFFIIKSICRKRAAAGEEQTAVGGEVEQKCPVYSNIRTPGLQERGDHRQETRQMVDDVSYASVQFKNKNQARPVVEADDTILYASVAKKD